MTQPSQRLLELIASFEGYRDKAYMCPGGKWTIGYGTTAYPETKQAVQRGDTCTRDQAWAWLTADADELMYQVKAAFTWEAPEHIVDACTSFTYNLGLTNFLESTFLKSLNKGDLQAGAAEIKWWNKARDPRTGEKRVLGGLRARRESEADLILNGWDGTAGGVPVEAAENKPRMIQSRTVLAAAGGIAATLGAALPTILQDAQNVRVGLSEATSLEELAVKVAGPLLAFVLVIWAKRDDIRKGSLGSQGR
jgi:lysozyme